MQQSKTTFKAYRVEEENGKFLGSVKEVDFVPLKENEIRVKVDYSSLNYKDALSASGNKGVTRHYPHTPGIDAVGVVEESTSSIFTIGEKVIVTSYDLGMNTDGGFAEYIQVPAEWAIKLPEQLTEKEAMIYGTAGLTAGMSVWRLVQQVKPEDGKIAVSGATGGVGSLSVSILSKLGYSVVAISGKNTEEEFLKSIGVDEVIFREDFENIDKKPLLKPMFAGAVDTVGGVILENIIKTTLPLGTVTCCGNVASPKLELTVFPFILRGVSLIGIDSQNFPMKDREKVWENLACDWKPINMEETSTEIILCDLPNYINEMLHGRLKGRTIVDLKK